MTLSSYELQKIIIFYETFHLLTLTKDQIQLILNGEISQKEFDNYIKKVLLTKEIEIKRSKRALSKKISLIHI